MEDVDEFGRPLVRGSPSRSRSPDSDSRAARDAAARSREKKRRRRSRSRSRSRSPPRQHRSLDRRRGRGGRGSSRRPRDRFGGRLLPMREWLQVEVEGRGEGVTAENRAELSRSYRAYKVAYNEKTAKRFFDSHRSESWLRHLYHPRHIADGQQQRRPPLSERAPWKESYPAFEKAFLDRDARKKGLDTEVDDMREFVLEMSPLPPSIPRSVIEELAKSANVTKLYIAKPGPQHSYCSAAWWFFEDARALDNAREKLDRHRVQGIQMRLRPPPEPVVQIRRAPHSTGSEERVKHDLQQATKLAQALDKRRGLEAPTVLFRAADKFEDEDTALNSLPTDVVRLNTVMAYLRRVHLYCYYCHTQYPDQEALYTRCGRVHGRHTKPQGAERAKEWMQALDEAVAVELGRVAEESDTQKQPTEEQAAVEKAENQKLSEQVWARFFERHVQELSPGKFKCQLCPKKFKAASFVHKHLRNKHPDECGRVESRVAQEQYFAAFMRDENRPGGAPSDDELPRDDPRHSSSVGPARRQSEGGVKRRRDSRSRSRSARRRSRSRSRGRDISRRRRRSRSRSPRARRRGGEDRDRRGSTHSRRGSDRRGSQRGGYLPWQGGGGGWQQGSGRRLLDYGNLLSLSVEGDNDRKSQQEENKSTRRKPVSVFSDEVFSHLHNLKHGEADALPWTAPDFGFESTEKFFSSKRGGAAGSDAIEDQATGGDGGKMEDDSSEVVQGSSDAMGDDN